MTERNRTNPRRVPRFDTPVRTRSCTTAGGGGRDLCIQRLVDRRELQRSKSHTESGSSRSRCPPQRARSQTSRALRSPGTEPCRGELHWHRDTVGRQQHGPGTSAMERLLFPARTAARRIPTTTRGTTHVTLTVTDELGQTPQPRPIFIMSTAGFARCPTSRRSGEIPEGADPGAPALLGSRLPLHDDSRYAAEQSWAARKQLHHPFSYANGPHGWTRSRAAVPTRPSRSAHRRGPLLRRRERSKGQGLVEFALAFPIVILLIVAVFDVGRLVFVYNSLTNAAREGARLAIVNQDKNHDQGPCPGNGLRRRLGECREPERPGVLPPTEPQSDPLANAECSLSPTPPTMAVGCIAVITARTDGPPSPRSSATSSARSHWSPDRNCRSSLSARTLPIRLTTAWTVRSALVNPE